MRIYLEKGSLRYSYFKLNLVLVFYRKKCYCFNMEKLDDRWTVFVNGGRIPTEKELFSWAKEAQERGAGEILFTSMNHDGTKIGYACEALRELSNRLSIPVIASGGAGEKEHFLEVFDLSRSFQFFSVLEKSSRASRRHSKIHRNSLEILPQSSKIL